MARQSTLTIAATITLLLVTSRMPAQTMDEVFKQHVDRKSVV